jgi:hypothetical protein
LALLGAQLAWGEGKASREYLLDSVGADRNVFNYRLVSVDRASGIQTTVVDFFTEGSDIDHFIVKEKPEGPVLYARLNSGSVIRVSNDGHGVIPVLGTIRSRFIAHGPADTILLGLTTFSNGLTMITADGSIKEVEVPGRIVLGASWAEGSPAITIITNDPTTFSRYETYSVDVDSALSLPTGTARVRSVGYFSGTGLFASANANQVEFTDAISAGVILQGYFGAIHHRAIVIVLGGIVIQRSRAGTE